MKTSNLDKQIELQEQGERICEKTFNAIYALKLTGSTPIPDVYMEWQKALRRALIDEGFLTMIMVDGEWQPVKAIKKDLSEAENE